MATWVIVGCGYTGERLADRLIAEGESVLATSRRAERCAELNAKWSGKQAKALSAASIPDGAIVVNSVPPTAGDTSFEEMTVANVAAAGGSRLIYLSSTGVYPRGDGEHETTEDTPTDPIGDRGVARLAAESATLAMAERLGLPAVALRIAGIYGPGRGVHARLRKGNYRIYGAGDALVSRIHVDDLVSAIVCAGRVETLRSRVYNIADSEPTSSRAHADGWSEALGLEPAPSVPLTEASDGARAMLGANRNISNRRAIAELGWQLRYPSWRDAISDLRESG